MEGIIFWLAVWFASIFLILKAADYAVDSVSRFAGKAGFSDFFVGLLIISISTSLPEFFTGITSSATENANLMLGNVFGASILDVTLVLGAVAVVSGMVSISMKKICIVPWRIILIAALPLLLAFDGKLSRFDGALMAAAFALYYAFNIYSEIRHQKIAKSIPFSFVWKEVFIFGANIAMLIFGALLLVESSVNISADLGIPQYIFGAIIISLCTTMPELVVEIKSSRKGKSAIAFGDLFGSVICNLGLVLGVSLMIHPVAIHFFDFYSFGLFLFAMVVLSQYFIIRGSIKRSDGILLILFYLIFIALQVLSRLYA